MAVLAIGLLIHRSATSTEARRRPDCPVWIALAVIVAAKIGSAVGEHRDSTERRAGHLFRSALPGSHGPDSSTVP
jgi:hypothetical protein